MSSYARDARRHAALVAHHDPFWRWGSCRPHEVSHYVAQAAVGRGDWHAPYTAEARASAWPVEAFERELQSWADADEGPPAVLQRDV